MFSQSQPELRAIFRNTQAWSSFLRPFVMWLVENFEYRRTRQKHLFAAIHDSAQVDDKEVYRLTEREREILTLFAQGMTYAQIAEVIGNTRLTIRNSIYRIQNKLEIRTKQGIVVWAARNGLLDDYVQIVDPRD